MSDASDNVCYSQQIFVPTDHNTHTFLDTRLQQNNEDSVWIFVFAPENAKCKDNYFIAFFQLHSFSLGKNFNLIVYSYLQIKTQIMP